MRAADQSINEMVDYHEILGWAGKGIWGEFYAATADAFGARMDAENAIRDTIAREHGPHWSIYCVEAAVAKFDRLMAPVLDAYESACAPALAVAKAKERAAF